MCLYNSTMNAKKAFNGSDDVISDVTKRIEDLDRKTRKSTREAVR